jgi:hypothetical protein
VLADHGAGVDGNLPIFHMVGAGPLASAAGEAQIHVRHVFFIDGQHALRDCLC